MKVFISGPNAYVELGYVDVDAPLLHEQVIQLLSELLQDDEDDYTVTDLGD